MSRLEVLARAAWREWSLYLKATRCSSCEAFTYCGARRQRGPWLCLDCHALTETP